MLFRSAFVSMSTTSGKLEVSILTKYAMSAVENHYVGCHAKLSTSGSGQEPSTGIVEAENGKRNEGSFIPRVPSRTTLLAFLT